MTDDVLDAMTEEQVLERLVRNKMKIEELTVESDLLKAYFKERPDVYVAGEKREVGKFYIRVTKQTRIDDALAKAVLPPKLYDRLVKTSIDTARAKRVLTQEQIDEISKKYDNRIEVGLN